MADSRYQRFLGLPHDIAKPDYYQILGLEPTAATPDRVARYAQERLVKLARRRTEDPEAVEALAEEVRRAERTLGDPGGRARYDTEERERRLREVERIVRYQIVDGVLSADAESTVLREGARLGLREAEVRGILEQILEDSTVVQMRREVVQKALAERERLGGAPAAGRRLKIAGATVLAATALVALLATGPRLPSPVGDAQDALRARVLGAAPEPGGLELRSEPAGAGVEVVAVSGQWPALIGTTPFVASGLPPGLYRCELRLEGHAPETIEVRVVPCMQEARTVQLRRQR
ncbi:MAG: J domain-containing protein [Planctomycetales bacterium]|nr:J domain-containing protein [Planctomycetales bacterium]